MKTDPFSIPSARPRLRWLVPAVALLIAAALGIMAAASIADAYRKAATNAERHLRTLSVALHEHARRTVGEIDAVLLHVLDDIDRRGLAPDLADPRVAALLRDHAMPSSAVAGLLLADAGGRPVAGVGSLRDHPPGLLADRAEFRAHRDHAEIGLQVALHLRDGAGRTLIAFTRRLSGADGSFAGIIVAALGADHFETFYHSLGIGDGGALALFHSDGTLLASSSGYDGIVGTSYAERPLFAAWLPEAESGVRPTPAQAGEAPALTGYAALDDYPLVVAVELAEARIYAGVRQMAYQYAALMAAIYLVLGLGVWLMYRHLRQQEAARTQLAESGDLLRSILDAIPVNISVKDRDGRYMLVNAQHARYLGASQNELVGEVSKRWVGDQYWSVSRARDRQVVQTRKPLGLFEESYLEKDGSTSHWLCNKVPVFDAGGNVRCLVSIGLDYTARRRAEDALHETERLAQEVIETALDAFVRIDEADRVLEWNRRAEAIFGWSRDEAVGRTLAQLIVPPEQREAHLRGLAAFCASGHGRALVNRRVEMTALRRDGETFRVEMSVTAMRRQDGWTFNAFLRDITERLAAEETLRQAHKMQAVGQLTGGVAHDFNNLLTVIIGNTELLRERLARQPELEQLADSIDVAAQRASTLTHRLLAFGRRQPLRPRLIDLNQAIIGCLPLIRTTLGEETVPLTELAADLWPAMVDENQLTNALLNLAANARDAMPGGGRLTIATANMPAGSSEAVGADGGDHVMVAVTDSGTGIPLELQPRVFEPFFTTKEVGKGSGLGLSMVYGFVKQSGGHIGLVSQPGHGTTVRLYFPRARSETAAQPHPAAA